MKSFIIFKHVDALLASVVSHLSFVGYNWLAMSGKWKITIFIECVALFHSNYLGYNISLILLCN